MSWLKSAISVILIIGYTIFAMWFICKRQSVRAIIGTSVVLICGGVGMVLAADFLVSVIYWAIFVCLILVILFSLFA